MGQPPFWNGSANPYWGTVWVFPRLSLVALACRVTHERERGGSLLGELWSAWLPGRDGSLPLFGAAGWIRRAERGFKAV